MHFEYSCFHWSSVEDSALPTNSVSDYNESMAVQPSTANKSVDNEDDNGDVVAGPTVKTHVTLAKTHKFLPAGCGLNMAGEWTSSPRDQTANIHQHNQETRTPSRMLMIWYTVSI